MPAVASASTPKSTVLDSAIVATVAATAGERLTVREIALRIGESEAVTAHCIALHRYLRRHAKDLAGAGVLSFPAPPDFVVPGPEDVIDARALGLQE